MTPSVTLSMSAATPSFLAASSNEQGAHLGARHAQRGAALLDRLAAGGLPLVGRAAVSPEIIVTRASGTSSSSAAIWASAVTMPWPSSTLPVNTVTLPSALMRSQASSVRLVCRLPGSRGGSCAEHDFWNEAEREDDATEPGDEVAARQVRRVHGQILPVCRAARSTRADDPVVGAAAAEIAGERRAHVRLLRLRVAIEQVGRRHDHAAEQ